jgi:NADH dehydrogenase/NADH:ubiquinone oxidoreductase subunit G
MGIDEADAILLVGVNPRREAAVLNARLRKAWLRMVPVSLLGERVDLTFDYKYLGAGPDSFRDLKAGHPVFDELAREQIRNLKWKSQKRPFPEDRRTVKRQYRDRCRGRCSRRQRRSGLGGLRGRHLDLSRARTCTDEQKYRQRKKQRAHEGLRNALPVFSQGQFRMA